MLFWKHQAHSPISPKVFGWGAWRDSLESTWSMLHFALGWPSARLVSPHSAHSCLAPSPLKNDKKVETGENSPIFPGQQGKLQPDSTWNEKKQEQKKWENALHHEEPLFTNIDIFSLATSSPMKRCRMSSGALLKSFSTTLEEYFWMLSCIIRPSIFWRIGKHRWPPHSSKACWIAKLP